MLSSELFVSWRGTKTEEPKLTELTEKSEFCWCKQNKKTEKVSIQFFSLEIYCMPFFFSVASFDVKDETELMITISFNFYAVFPISPFNDL